MQFVAMSPWPSDTCEHQGPSTAALGDVADSPLIQLKQNQEMSYRAGILVVRRFGGN